MVCSIVLVDGLSYGLFIIRWKFRWNFVPGYCLSARHWMSTKQLCATIYASIYVRVCLARRLVFNWSMCIVCLTSERLYVLYTCRSLFMRTMICVCCILFSPLYVVLLSFKIILCLALNQTKRNVGSYLLNVLFNILYNFEFGWIKWEKQWRNYKSTSIIEKSYWNFFRIIASANSTTVIITVRKQTRVPTRRDPKQPGSGRDSGWCYFDRDKPFSLVRKNALVRHAPWPVSASLCKSTPASTGAAPNYTFVALLTE